MLVRGIPLRVVGVYAAKGQSAYGQDQDDLVMIPFSTAERKVLGVATTSAAAAANSQYPQAPNRYAGSDTANLPGRPGQSSADA